MIEIVLLEPEIPQNTGNIIRSCAATGARLHLIGNLGFSLEDKYLKRASLDYQDLALVEYHGSLEEFFSKYPDKNCYYSSTKVHSHPYSEISYQPGDVIFFGPETRGLPRELLEANRGRSFRIPMLAQARSLNLSNAVAIVLYEALRQLDFPELV